MELAELFGHTDDKEAHKKGDPDDEGIDDEEHDETKTDAVAHLSEMLRKGDHKGARAALEAFMDMHHPGGKDSEDEDALKEDDGHKGEHDEDDLKL